MRDKVLKKISSILKKQSGATIVFALAVFTIAAVISVTIVNVAMENMNRVASRGSNEQARLAVVSAAKYLESDNAQLKTVLNSMTAPGEIWTVHVADTDANNALETTIKWTDVSNKSVMMAEVSSGGYTAKVSLTYDLAHDKWSISRFKKK